MADCAMSKEQIVKGLEDLVQATRAIGEFIQTMGSVRSGVLYAHLAGKMSLETYQGFISILKQAKLIEEKPGFLLVWRGPKLGGN